MINAQNIYDALNGACENGIYLDSDDEFRLEIGLVPGIGTDEREEFSFDVVSTEHDEVVQRYRVVMELMDPDDEWYGRKEEDDVDGGDSVGGD